MTKHVYEPRQAGVGTVEESLLRVAALFQQLFLMPTVAKFFPKDNTNYTYEEYTILEKLNYKFKYKSAYEKSFEMKNNM